MLPNHAPLVIAEQFGTLAALFPGRIDLGLGRAPGTDRLTARALRRDLESGADDFPQDVVELQALLQARAARPAVRAVPGAGLEVPLWLLGSSLYSAQLAAALGLPFAFASHFAPDLLRQAASIYRARFQPSAAARAAVRDARRQRLRGGHGRRGAPPLHVPPAGVRQPAPRGAGAAAAARRRDGGPLDSRGESDGRAHAQLTRSSARRRRFGGGSRSSWMASARTRSWPRR